MKNLLVVFFLILSLSAYSQNNYSISGRTLSKSDKSIIEFAAVIAINDTIKIRKGVETNKLGQFTIMLPKGQYYFEVSLLGYAKYVKQIDVNQDINMGDIYLDLISEHIKGATITASMVQHNLEGYKLNVKNNKVFMNLSMPDILRTTPGMWVTDNSLSVYGKPATVYIDNVKQKISGAELSNFLKSFNGKDIENIDVISNPGFEYRGESAVIKITTNKEEGGRLSASLQYIGRDNSNVLRPNILLSYRKNKILLNTNVSYTYLQKDNNYQNTIYSKENEIKSNQISNNSAKVPTSILANIGLNYDISKNDLLSVNVFAKYLKRKENRLIESIDYTDGNINRSSIRNIVDDFRDINLNLSGLYTHNFKAKEKIEVRANYLFGNNDRSYLDTTFNVNSNLNKQNTNKTYWYNVQADYFNSFCGKADNFLAGINYNGLNNKINEDTFLRHGLNLDETNHYYNYKEDIALAYASYTYNFNLIAIRAGLKGEYSYINSNSYFNFIPDILLSLHLNKKRGSLLRLGYTRTVRRPNMNMLDPMPRTYDNYIQLGNPQLKPSTGDKLEANITIRNNYVLSVNYNYEKDVVSNYVYKAEDGNIYYQPINSASARSLNVSAQVSLMLFKRWNINTRLGYTNYTQKNDKITSKNDMFFVSVFTMLMLPYKMDISAILDWNSKSVKGLNTIEKAPLYANLSLSKSFFKNNLKFSINISDIFNSDKNRERIVDFGNSIQSTKYKYGSRTYGFSVNFNLNWGKRVLLKNIDYKQKEITDRLSD